MAGGDRAAALEDLRIAAEQGLPRVGIRADPIFGPLRGGLDVRGDPEVGRVRRILGAYCIKEERPGSWPGHRLFAVGEELDGH